MVYCRNRDMNYNAESLKEAQSQDSCQGVVYFDPLPLSSPKQIELMYILQMKINHIMILQIKFVYMSVVHSFQGQDGDSGSESSHQQQQKKGTKDKNKVLSNLNKKPGKGRPRKDTTQSEVNDSSCDQLWIANKKTIEITRILGVASQIMFKSLSGPRSKGTQNSSGSAIERQIKEDRQDYIRYLNSDWQSELLKKLGYKSVSIDNESGPIDKPKPKPILYLLLGRPKQETQESIIHDTTLRSLLSIIDSEFIYSLSVILNNQPKQSKAEIINYPVSYKYHKMLYDWALIKTLHQEGEDLLSQLQGSENPRSENFESTYKESIKKSQGSYNSLLKESPDTLFRRYQAEVTQRIEQLIDELTIAKSN